MSIKVNGSLLKNSGAIFLGIVACIQFFWLYVLNSVALLPSFTDVLGTNIFLYALILVVKFSRGGLFFFYSRFVSVGLQSLLLAWFWTNVSLGALTSVFSGEKRFVALWHETALLRGFTTWIILSSFTLIFYLTDELDKIKDLVAEEKQAEQLRKDAELFKLRQQLQPHFLFNSLNSINALIGREPQRARQMVQQLSDYLRNTIKKEDNSFISFGEEMDDLRLYLAIEQVRFGHRLHVEEHLELECEAMKVPPFLLQPLVENAIKYGLYGTTGSVVINITVKTMNKELLFTISNPYDADTVTVKGTGFGLESIRRRLYLLFARNDLLKITQGVQPATDGESSGLRTFTVTLTIPFEDHK